MSLAPKFRFRAVRPAPFSQLRITHVEDAANTLRTHQKAFIARGLTEALTRVIAIVVQPGVEIDHSNIIHYQPQEARRRWRNG